GASPPRRGGAACRLAPAPRRSGVVCRARLSIVAARGRLTRLEALSALRRAAGGGQVPRRMRRMRLRLLRELAPDRLRAPCPGRRRLGATLVRAARAAAGRGDRVRERRRGASALAGRAAVAPAVARPAGRETRALSALRRSPLPPR